MRDGRGTEQGGAGGERCEYAGVEVRGEALRRDGGGGVGGRGFVDLRGEGRGEGVGAYGGEVEGEGHGGGEGLDLGFLS